MKHRIAAFLAVALLGGALFAAPAANASNILENYQSKSVEIPHTGYDFSFSGSDSYLKIWLVRKTKKATQAHEYIFSLDKFNLSDSMDKGRIVDDFGSLGKVDLRFDATAPTVKTVECGGEIIIRKRKGVVNGILKLKPDTQGNEYFKTIKIEHLGLTMERVTYKNCPDRAAAGGGGSSQCPRGLALFAGEVDARKVQNGNAKFEIYQSEPHPDASSIRHIINSKTDNPDKFTYTKDLQQAHVSFSIGTPMLGGSLNYTGTSGLNDAGGGNCGDGHTWTSDYTSGNVTGHVTGHFDSYGNATLSPPTGVLQRWTTIP